MDVGKTIDIKCDGGCINITKAMYSCVADSHIMVPGHMELLSSKCNGKEECYAEACDSFWGTKLKCASFDKEQLWLHYRCVHWEHSWPPYHSFRCDGKDATHSEKIGEVICTDDNPDGGALETPNTKDNRVCSFDVENYKGKEIQRDIFLGQTINIKCSNGCIKITKAMYSCVADSHIMVPAHMELLSSKCDGKEECYAEACDSFWGTNLKCASFDKAQLWIHYRLNFDMIISYVLCVMCIGYILQHLSILLTILLILAQFRCDGKKAQVKDDIGITDCGGSDYSDTDYKFPEIYF